MIMAGAAVAAVVKRSSGQTDQWSIGRDNTQVHVRARAHTHTPSGSGPARRRPTGPCPRSAGARPVRTCHTHTHTHTHTPRTHARTHAHARTRSRSHETRTEPGPASRLAAGFHATRPGRRALVRVAPLSESSRRPSRPIPGRHPGPPWPIRVGFSESVSRPDDRRCRFSVSPGTAL